MGIAIAVTYQEQNILCDSRQESKTILCKSSSLS